MPQSKWERGFWAAVRDKDNILPSGKEFNPYPPEHWRPKKGKKVKKKLGTKNKHWKIVSKGHDGKLNTIVDFNYIDRSKQLTFFD